MAELVLMERNGEQMNVPGDKVPAFLKEGWKEISRKPADAPAPVAVETPTPEPEPADDKPKGKGKA